MQTRPAKWRCPIKCNERKNNDRIVRSETESMDLFVAHTSWFTYNNTTWTVPYRYFVLTRLSIHFFFFLFLTPLIHTINRGHSDKFTTFWKTFLALFECKLEERDWAKNFLALQETVIYEENNLFENKSGGEISTEIEICFHWIGRGEKKKKKNESRIQFQRMQKDRMWVITSN